MTSQDRPNLKVAAVQIYHTFENGTLLTGGITGDFLNLLAKYLNFQYTLVVPPDGKYGSQRPDGSWNGMIGMVNNSEVEFSIGPFSLNPDRNSAVQFTHPIIYDNEIILSPRPKLQSDIQGFIKPFPLEVWLLVLASFIAVSLSMVCLELLEGMIFHFNTSNIFHKSFSWALKVITQEGSEWLPKKDGGRVLVATWLMSAIVFVSAYSGILIAMLTLPRVNIPIDSIEDLVRQNDIPWKLVENTDITRILRDSKDEFRHKAYTGSEGFINECNDNRTELANGEFASICPGIRTTKILYWDYRNTGKCRMYIAKERVYSDILSFAFRPDSPYFDRSNKIIIGALESGISSRLLNKHYPSPSRCLLSPTHDKPSGITALDIKSIGGPFLLLIGGFILSSYVLFLEVITQRFKHQQS